MAVLLQLLNSGINIILVASADENLQKRWWVRAMVGEGQLHTCHD